MKRKRRRINISWARHIIFLLVVFFFTTSCQDDPKPAIPIDEPLTIPAPDIWWNDQVFYEVFVRSFYDSDGNGIGDFQGIIQKLDYLNDGNPDTHTDLGVTALWLMPVFSSPSYHGYDVTDYRNVNSQYGSMNDFKQLIDEAHQRGIKVIIDFVINHTSEQHPWFTNSASSSDAEKRNWYIWSILKPSYSGPWGQSVWHEKDNNYYYGLFWSGMPDLNYRNEQVTEEIEDIARYWYQDIGVDGFRLDAAGGLIEEGENQANTQSTLNWWRKFYAFQKNLDPALMTVGEIWSSTSVIIPYTDQRMDYCFEFDLSYAIIDALKNGNKINLESKMEEVASSYSALQYGTFLTNHDQNRVIEELGLDVNKAKAAAGILLSLPGIPYLYYGEEVGMRGQKPDEDIRRPMQWTDGPNAGFTSGFPWRQVNSNYSSFNVTTMQNDSSSLWNHYRKLIHARLGSNPLKHGNYEPAISNYGSVFSFMRVKDDKAVLTVHNLRAQVLQDVQLSMESGSLSSGNYTVTEILTGLDLGTLVIGSNGSFTGFTPIQNVESYSTYLLSLEKQ